MKSHIIMPAIIMAALFSFGAKAGEKYRPAIAGPYRPLFQPREYGDDINDHTVFRDGEGNWRMIGILSSGLNLLNTPAFAHGVGSSLDEVMAELPPIFGEYPDKQKKWAPHVTVEDGVYHLFAGPGKIRHYTSGDGVKWSFQSIVISSDWDDFRDTMVLKISDGVWLMYVTDRDNSVSVYESNDLENWTDKGTAFHAVKPAAAYPKYIDISSCESPFVIEYSGYYYLSVCLTSGLKPKTYADTVIVRSEDPYRFGAYAGGGPGQTCDYVTTLEAHAAEYVQDEKGNWFITSAGWRQFPTPPTAEKGSLNIAPLTWEKE